MARPQKNNLSYFSHDNGMRNDRKVKALRSKFGLTGYAIFNMILEILCESEMLVIEWKDSEIELISGDLNIVSEELIQIIEYLIKIELIQKANNYIFCEQLDIRSSDVFDKRIHNLDSLRKINGINLSETIVLGEKTPQSKVKKSKENNYNDFYISELKKTDDQNYHKFVNWLLGENENKEPFKKCLSMNNQIGYEQFCNLMAIQKIHGTKISDKIIELENGFSKYNKTSLNLTLINWLKRDFKK